MHAFDIIIVAIATIFIVIGIKRGFIEESFHLAAMLGGFVGAYLTYSLIYDKIGFIKTSAQTKTIISFILAYIAIAFIILVAGWILKKLVHMTLLGWIDRLFGGLIGFTKATIFIWIFILSISILPSSQLKSAFSSSTTYNILTKLPVYLTVPHSNSYKNITKSATFKKLKDTKEKLDKLKTKIDSFKIFGDSI